MWKLRRRAGPPWTSPYRSDRFLSVGSDWASPYRTAGLCAKTCTGPPWWRKITMQHAEPKKKYFVVQHVLYYCSFRNIVNLWKFNFQLFLWLKDINNITHSGPSPPFPPPPSGGCRTGPPARCSQWEDGELSAVPIQDPPDKAEQSPASYPPRYLTIYVFGGEQPRILFGKNALTPAPWNKYSWKSRNVHFYCRQLYRNCIGDLQTNSLFA